MMGANSLAAPLNCSSQESTLCPVLALDNVSSTHRLLRNSEVALDFAKRALQAREEVLGMHHPDTAASLTNTGLMYSEVGRFNEALDYQGRALAMTEELFGTRSALRAIVLRNTGLIHYGKQDFFNALNHFQEAFDIRNELFGDMHVDTIISAVDCARSLFQLNRIHQGHAILEKWSKKLKSDHPFYARLKEERLRLQQQYPRPGFRQLPKSRRQ